MQHKKQRRMGATVGVLLLVGFVGAVMFVRNALVTSPLIAAQAGALAGAAVLKILVGFKTPLTDHFDWYRLSGFANVLLSFSLPLGLAGTTGTLPLVLVFAGSLILAGMGIDMLMYEGKHVYSEPLNSPDTAPKDSEPDEGGFGHQPQEVRS